MLKIEQMIRDAEANAAEDAKFAELAQVRNEADGRIHGVQKAMKDAADKVTDSDKTAVEDAIKALELAVKEDNLDDIKSKLEALDNAFLPVSQKIYVDAGATAEADGAQPQQTQQDDGVVDAEFTEVKDDNK